MAVSAPLRSPDTPGAGAAAAAVDRVAELQSRIRGMEATKLGRETPTHPAIAEVLGGGMREGAVYRASGATSLVMAMLAGPSAAGRWCAVVGMPGFGIEAAVQAGIRLDRLVLVPEPGAHWFAVVAALADAIPVIAVRQPERVGSAEANRLAARLRQRGAILITTGEWPQVEASVRLRRSEWHGLEAGHGLLTDREALVERQGRGGFGPSRRVRLALPGEALEVGVLPEPAPLVLVPAPDAGPAERSAAPDGASGGAFGAPGGAFGTPGGAFGASVGGVAELVARIRWAGGTHPIVEPPDGRVARARGVLDAVAGRRAG